MATPPSRVSYDRWLADCWAHPNRRKSFFQWLARMGDPYPIAKWLGIDYISPVLPDDLDLSEEWKQHRIHAARWIRDTYERIYEQVPKEERMRPGRENPSRCW
jgi:hypothetical protein